MSGTEARQKGNHTVSRVRTSPAWVNEGPRTPDPYASANAFDRYDSSRLAQPVRLPTYQLPRSSGGPVSFGVTIGGKRMVAA
jgi:hypothetical protein